MWSHPMTSFAKAMQGRGLMPGQVERVDERLGLTRWIGKQSIPTSSDSPTIAVES